MSGQVWGFQPAGLRQQLVGVSRAPTPTPPPPQPLTQPASFNASSCDVVNQHCSGITENFHKDRVWSPAPSGQPQESHDLESLLLLSLLSRGIQLQRNRDSSRPNKTLL
ncbi:hypothetical protein RRG08_062344 [Elysia crispata]|uniref:Uncharacterized protein n=1 Tax=Elysia crispata TaxID=231223 RepID=A0AAE1CYC2_9GAST|nr:hypothetical protein RRG08_062344 [Elysia crispata]